MIKVFSMKILKYFIDDSDGHDCLVDLWFSFYSHDRYLRSNVKLGEGTRLYSEDRNAFASCMRRSVPNRGQWKVFTQREKWKTFMIRRSWAICSLFSSFLHINHSRLICRSLKLQQYLDEICLDAKLRKNVFLLRWMGMICIFASLCDQISHYAADANQKTMEIAKTQVG